MNLNMSDRVRLTVVPYPHHGSCLAVDRSSCSDFFLIVAALLALVTAGMLEISIAQIISNSSEDAECIGQELILPPTNCAQATSAYV